MCIRDRMEKVDRSGLKHHFDAIEILEKKSPGEYQQIIEHHALDVSSTWMIGNSPRSDIEPALAVGLGAVFIAHTDTWSHEAAPIKPHPRLIELALFSELLDHF